MVESAKGKLPFILKELSLARMELFCELAKYQSIREVARLKKVDPGFISRWISQLEKKLNTRLLERTLEGVALTERGLEIQKAFEKILAASQDVTLEKSTTDLSVGSTAFLNTRVVAPVLIRYLKQNPDLSFRLVDFSPDEFVAAGLRGAFELSLHVGPLEWPTSWVSQQVGEIYWGLYAAMDHPLAKKRGLKEADLLEFPFVYPIYWTRSGLAFGNDHCPLPRERRGRGMGTATADAALAVIQLPPQLAFLPEVLCRDEVKKEKVVELKIQGWSEVRKAVYLSVRSDLIKKKNKDELATRISQFLK